MTLAEFLTYLLTPAGCGTAVWAAIRWADNLKQIPPDAKFWSAIALSLVLPTLAYAAEIALGLATLSYEGAFAVAGVAYLVSQGVHRGTEG